MEPTLGNFMNFSGGGVDPVSTLQINATQTPPLKASGVQMAPLQSIAPTAAPSFRGASAPSPVTPSPVTPSPVTPSSGPTYWPSVQPVNAGNNMTSLGSSLGSVAGGAYGGPVGYVAGGVVGGGVGYLIDSFISAREKEEKKKELERQMRMSMMKQRYDNSKAAAAQRLSQIPTRMARWDQRSANTRQLNQDKLNRIYSSIENRVKSGFLQGA